MSSSTSFTVDLTASPPRNRSIHHHMKHRRSSSGSTQISRLWKSIGFSILWLGVVNMIMLWSFHPAGQNRYNLNQSLSSFRRRRLRNMMNTDDVVVIDFQPESVESRDNTLRCTDYGGPQSEYYTDLMMYWEPNSNNNDTTTATPTALPSTDSHHGELYLTFESDRSSPDSVRLVWETVTALAWSTNRTLVVPPREAMPQLRQQYDSSWRRQSTTFSYMDLYELEADSSQIHMISMEEFLERMSGSSAIKDDRQDNAVLRDLTTGEVVPPLSRWNWDDEEHPQELEEYLRRIGQYVPRFSSQSTRKKKKHTNAETAEDMSVTSSTSWNPQECILLMSDDDDMNTNKTLASLTEILYEEDQLSYHKDSSLGHRFQEMYAGRTKMCTYDQDRRNQRVLHLPSNRRDNRLFVPFYAFILSREGHRDVQLRHYIRNHVRYANELQCAAARIIEYLQEVVSDDGTFSAIHLRRGSFSRHYDSFSMDASAILNQSQPEIPLGSTIFVAATDATDGDEDLASYLAPFREVHAHVITMKDLLLEPSLGLEFVNSNILGLVTQLVCARGTVFFGHRFSAFSAYITRLRGYHANNARRYDNEEAGVVTEGSSYFYAPADDKYLLQEVPFVHKPIQSREYPMGWRMH